MRAALASALLLLIACQGAATPAAPSATAARPTATGHIDVYDMMGAFPNTTFFVVTPDSVKALALLNHTTKYAIPLAGGDAQVAVHGARLYVMDQVPAGARLRRFDVATGNERTSRVLAGLALVEASSARAALAIDGSSGRLFALLRSGSVLVVDELDRDTLAPLRHVLGDLRCGERIAAAGGRVVLACMSEGGLVVHEAAGGGKFRADAPLVAMAMLDDGTLMAGSADASLWRLAKDAARLEPIGVLRDRGARLVPDGIARQEECCFVYGLVESVSNVQVRILSGGYTLLLFPETSRPEGGILVEQPFAYYTVGAQARHVDVQQGFGELMADVGSRARPGAVATER